MLNIIAVSFLLFGTSSAFEFIKATGENLKFAHQDVFDWMKVLTNQEIYALIAQKEVQWPTYDEIPPPSFSCAEKSFPGFYADPATQCQTFHRCDINGNLTSYICVNRTVFNPITLICDQWFSAGCSPGYRLPMILFSILLIFLVYLVCTFSWMGFLSACSLVNDIKLPLTVKLKNKLFLCKKCGQMDKIPLYQFLLETETWHGEGL